MFDKNQLSRLRVTCNFAGRSELLIYLANNLFSIMSQFQMPDQMDHQTLISIELTL